MSNIEDNEEQTEVKIDKGGHRTGKPLNAKHKQAIAATKIMERVKQCANGEIEMTKEQLQASQLYLSKTMPSLSNVEQTIVNDQDSKTLEQIQAELIALVQAQPELLTMLNNIINPAINSQPIPTINTSLESRH